MLVLSAVWWLVTAQAQKHQYDRPVKKLSPFYKYQWAQRLGRMSGWDVDAAVESFRTGEKPVKTPGYEPSRSWRVFVYCFLAVAALQAAVLVAATLF